MDALVTAAHANLPAPHPNMAAVFMCPSIKICACTLAYPVTIPLLLKYIAAEPAWNVQLILWMTLWVFPTAKPPMFWPPKLICSLLASSSFSASCWRTNSMTWNLPAAPENSLPDFYRSIILRFAACSRRPCFYTLFCCPVLPPYFSLMLICFFSSSFAIT